MVTMPDPCGCDPATEPAPLGPTYNRPGLSSLDRRVGAHGEFLAAMRSALGRQDALAQLTTRADDDPGMALLDAWAMVLDVLAFYAEHHRG